MAPMPLFQIKSRFTNQVQFECELPADVACKHYRFQLGFAAQKAVEADANLAGANLAGADLAYANLADANLADANLAGADLAGADLAYASFPGANFAGAKWRNDITLQRAPIVVHGLNYSVIILDQHMQIGCELHLTSDWAAFDNERIARMDGTRSRRFWDKYRDTLLLLAHSDGRGVEPASALADAFEQSGQ